MLEPNMDDLALDRVVGKFKGELELNRNRLPRQAPTTMKKS